MTYTILFFKAINILFSIYIVRTHGVAKTGLSVIEPSAQVLLFYQIATCFKDNWRGTQSNPAVAPNRG